MPTQLNNLIALLSQFKLRYFVDRRNPARVVRKPVHLFPEAREWHWVPVLKRTSVSMWAQNVDKPIENRTITTKPPFRIPVQQEVNERRKPRFVRFYEACLPTPKEQIKSFCIVGAIPEKRFQLSAVQIRQHSQV